MGLLNLICLRRDLLIRTMSLLFLIGLIGGSASAATSDIMISEHTIDPPILMQGDIAEVMVTIKNTGNSSVTLKDVKMFGITGQIDVVDGRQGSLGDIGSGNFRNFTFTIKSVGDKGVFYPKFVLSYWSSGADLRYVIPVEVDDTNLVAAVILKPDAFLAEKKETIKIRVANPRENELNGIIIVPEGEGVIFSPERAFIGKIAKNNYSDVSFDIRALRESDMVFEINYRNGINWHSINLPLGIETGTGKKHAELVINNVEIQYGAGYYTVTGEVFNTGLETALSVVMTTNDNVRPVDPYRFDVVGALEPDDSSSFTVTFLPDGADIVEIIGIFKDIDGNEYSSGMSMNLIPSTDLSGTKDEGSLPWYLVIVIVLSAAGVVLVIYRSWARII